MYLLVIGDTIMYRYFLIIILLLKFSCKQDEKSSSVPSEVNLTTTKTEIPNSYNQYYTAIDEVEFFDIYKLVVRDEKDSITEVELHWTESYTSEGFYDDSAEKRRQFLLRLVKKPEVTFIKQKINNLEIRDNLLRFKVDSLLLGSSGIYNDRSYMFSIEYPGDSLKVNINGMIYKTGLELEDTGIFYIDN